MADLGSAVGSIVLGFDSSGVDQATAALSGLQSKANALQSVGANIAGLGAAIGGPLVASVKVAADFNQELANIASVGGKAAQDSMQQISDTALQLGKDTAFSASEAASGMEELIKAGVPVQDVLDGAAASALNLSAATGTAVPESATLMATALNVFSDSMAGFNSEGEKATHIADLFAQTANASAADVHQLGFAFEQSANVAKLLGLSVDDTAASIGILSNAGLKGSDAGTSFKQMLISLVNPSAGAKKELTALGLSIDNFFGPDGTFIGVPGAFDTLRAAMENAGVPAGEVAGKLAKIFGSDAVRAAGVFFNTTDQGWTDFRANMDTAGTAADQAQTRLNTFEGALETFRGSVETLAIQVGTIFLPVLVDIVHHLTDLVNAFIAANPQIQQFVAIFGAIGAVLLTATGGALLAAGHILRLIQVLDYAGVSVKTLAASLGLLGLAIGAGILAYQTNFLGFADAVNGALSAVQEAISKFSLVFGRAFDTRRLRGLSSVGAVIGAIGRSIKQTFGINLTDQFNALGHAVDAVTASFKQALDAGFNPVAAALDALAQGFYVLGLNDVADLFDRAGVAVQDFGRIFQKFSLISQKSGMNDFASAIYAFGVALGNVTGLPVIGFFRTLADAVQTFGDTFQRASERGVNPIEAAFIALRRVLRDVVGIDLRGFTDALGNVANGIKAIGLSVARGDFAAIPGILSTIGQSLSESFSGLVISLTDWVLNVAAPTLIGWVETAVTWLSGQIGPLVSGIPAALGEVKDWLLNVGLPTLGGWVDVATSWIAEHLGAVVTAVVAVAVDFAGWVLNVGVPTLAGWVNIAATWIGDQLRPVAEAVAGVAVDFAGWVLNVGVPTLAGWINVAASWLHDTLTGIVGVVTGVAADFADWVVNVAVPTLAGWVSIAASWLHDTLTGIVSGVAGVTADFSQWVVTVGEPTLAGWVNIAGAWLHDNLLPVIAGIPQITEGFQNWVLTVAAPAIDTTKLDLQKSLHDAIQPLLDTLDATKLLDLATTSSKVGAAFDKALVSIGVAIVDAFNALTDPNSDVAKGISDALLALGGVIVSVVVGFATGFVLGKEVDFHQIGDQIRERLQAAIDSVGQAFSGFSEVGLGGINGPGLLQGLSDQLFKSFQQAAVDIAARLTQIDWSAIPEAIKNGIGDALANFGTQLFGASTAEAASADAGGFDSAAAGKQFGDQFVQAFQDPAFVGAVKDAIDQIPTAAFADVGIGLMTKIGDSITASLQAPIGVSESGVAGGAGLGARLITNIVTGLTSAVSGADFTGFAAAFATDAGTAIATGLQQITSALQAQAGVWLITFTNTFSSLASAATAGMAEVITPVTDGLQQITSAISAQAAVWTPTVEAFLAPMANALAGGFDAMLGAVQAEMTAITTAVTTGLQQITSALEAQAAVWPTAMTTAMDQVSAAITNGMAAATAALQGGVDALIATLQGAGAQAFDAGLAIGEGLSRGMQAALTDVQAAAASLATAAEQAVRSQAQISSPSKVFYDLGQQTGQGYADGLTSLQQQVTDASAALVKAAADGATGMFEGSNGLIANFGKAWSDFRAMQVQSQTRLSQTSQSMLDSLRAGRSILNQQHGDLGSGKGFGLAAGPGMSSWDDWISQQTRPMREALRRARQAGQLTAQHRQDLMAGGNIADFINDTSRRQPPQIINTTGKVTMDGREMGDFVVQQSIGAMTQVPHRGGHRNSRFSLAGA